MLGIYILGCWEEGMTLGYGFEERGGMMGMVRSIRGLFVSEHGGESRTGFNSFVMLNLHCRFKTRRPCI